jgi:hypothetical protein
MLYAVDWSWATLAGGGVVLTSASPALWNAAAALSESVTALAGDHGTVRLPSS